MLLKALIKYFKRHTIPFLLFFLSCSNIKTKILIHNYLYPWWFSLDIFPKVQFLDLKIKTYLRQEIFVVGVVRWKPKPPMPSVSVFYLPGHFCPSPLLIPSHWDRHDLPNGWIWKQAVWFRSFLVLLFSDVAAYIEGTSVFSFWSDYQGWPWMCGRVYSCLLCLCE